MIQKEHAGKLLAGNIVLMPIAKHPTKPTPNRITCLNKVQELEKLWKLMTKIPIWEKLEHLMISVILLESYLIISEISIQHVQIGILPILVPA